jgi:predicted N-acyltransferase
LSDIHFEIINSITEVTESAWNAISGIDNPFTRYEFFHALEMSGATTESSGWQPQHVLIKQDDKLIGILPCFLKYHSYGEYVFDWAWADAYQRYNMRYYPKLLSAVPFTPSVGPRLLLKSSVSEQDIANLLLEWLINYAGRSHISSWHLLFPDANTSSLLHNSTLIERRGCQFHWFNQGYEHFDDFLAKMSSRKRKNLRKERAKVQEQGIDFQFYTGQEMTDDILESFYQFYQATYYKKGRPPYLNIAFFKQLAQSMGNHFFLCMPSNQGQFVAGASFFKDNTTLYGRHWGCLKEYDLLHFECCYYQGIEYCIQHHLQRFDAGAQGEHKIQRGFEPVHTVSYHWITHEGFRYAIQEAVEEENKQVASYMETARHYLPFK